MSVDYGGFVHHGQERDPYTPDLQPLLCMFCSWKMNKRRESLSEVRIHATEELLAALSLFSYQIQHYCF